MAPSANTTTGTTELATIEGGLGGAIAVRSSADLDALRELADTIRDNKRVEVVDDPEQISREIFEQILGSESDADLNQLGAATGWRELEGVPIVLDRGPFRWRPSSYEQGAPIFLVVPASKLEKDGTLTPVVLTTGSMNVIAQMMNMAARGTLAGRQVRLERAEKPSAAGYYPLWLQVDNPSAGAEQDADTEAADVDPDAA